MAPISGSLEYSAKVLLPRESNEHGSWRGGLTLAGVDLVAMVVSDSGLSSIVPQWWNASPLGCALIGTQPRGGWQVFQRAAQWGDDVWAHAFGVNCTKPILYEYFACSMRNRIEVWNSSRWTSPMEGDKGSRHWQAVGESRVSRPTKLIDGSRGGQAFMCSLLRPKDSQRYSIGQQARAQLQSIILVAAGFMNLENQTGVVELENALREDFEFSDRLGVVFSRLFPIISVANLLVLAAVTSLGYSLWEHSLYGKANAYIIKLCSLAAWVVGATGLLMMGGNPRVKLITHDIPDFVEERLSCVAEKGDQSGSDSGSDSEAEKETTVGLVTLEFGSVHGSLYTPDYGENKIPLEVLRAVCQWDIEIHRSWRWFSGVAWFGMMMLVSIGLQLAGVKCASISSELLGIALLVVTSVLRGTGISGREEWLIPKWKTRARYGATLQGVLESRSYSV